MKKLAFVIGCFSCIVLFNVSHVSAEEPVSESSSTSLANDSSTTESSTVKMSSSDSGLLPTDSTETSLDDTVPNFRQSLLSYVPDYNLTEELINRLTDDQLENAQNMASHFINQDISGSIKMVVKIYGDNPIPEEAYSVNYTKLSTGELKNYLPQIRLSLIYVYDLDKKIIDSISDQELIDLLDSIKLEFDNSDRPAMNAHGEYAIATMADKIKSGNYVSSNSSSSTDNDNTNEKSSTETTKAVNSKEDTNKKGNFPNTGEKRNKVLVVLGISIIILLIVTIFIRNRKKHS
ncbi:LPXTG cell wall anchor domain-containing protein [Enterococcus rotai]|uniref:LPXTG cell wall anchor domain-containing protein n=1 Tax=Enterococcus rotai TaxID=118060 RepID=UPI0032B60A7D